MRENVKIIVWGGMWKLMYKEGFKINIWGGIWKLIYERECEN
jgi:hypothetical protein